MQLLYLSSQPGFLHQLFVSREFSYKIHKRQDSSTSFNAKGLDLYQLAHGQIWFIAYVAILKNALITIRIFSDMAVGKTKPRLPELQDSSHQSMYR
jgi:hypothetical protein